jgi:hypothetical protein
MLSSQEEIFSKSWCVKLGTILKYESDTCGVCFLHYFGRSEFTADKTPCTSLVYKASE